MGPIAPGVDDPLRNALVVEVEHLLAVVMVFHQHRTAGALPQRVLIVRHRVALLRGQRRHTAAGDLVRLAA